jgi:hypothetical protein
VIDEEDGRIESTYLGRRYEIHVDAVNRMRRARLDAADRGADPSEGEGNGEREEPSEAGAKEDGGVTAAPRESKGGV